MLERLRLEASIQARLNHSHIVQVYEIGLLDSSPFIAMEFIKGRSLRELLENQPMEAAAAARLVAKLAVAIHHAHVAGVLHCDLKPSNILIEQRNEDKDSEFEPKIADFGLAKLMDETGVVSESSVLAGTPAYLSPEQAGNDRCAVGSASDIYTLGVILYECLTGHPPFNANNTGLLLEMIKGLEPVSPRKLVPGISRNLETICLKCLSKDPARRYLSAQALADDLCHFLEGRPILARPAGSLETVSRWCMRNRRLAASLTTIFLMTIFFLAYAFWSAADQRNLRLLAEAETRRANESELAAMSQRNMAYSYLLEKLHKFKAIMTMLDNPQIKLANVKGVTEIQMQINDSIREETRQILKDPQLLETKPEIVFQMLYLQSMISRMVNDQSGFKQSTTRLIGLFFELKDPSTELAIDYLNASHLLANNLIGEHDTAGAMNIWERVWQSYATGKLNEYLNRQETQRSLQINLSGYQYFLAKCGQMKKAGAVGNGLASLKQFQTPLK
jgi:serine/threonine protein kinase